jgi:ribokinase
MTRDYDVITVGEATMDAFMTLHDSHDKYHLTEKGELCFRHGEKINVEKYDFCMGGNAANVAVGLSRLGFKATICGETGDDEFSIKIRNSLAKEEVERLFLIQKPGNSHFSVIINFKGERTIFSEHRERENDFKLEEVSTRYFYLTSLGRKWEHAYKQVLDFALKNDVKIAFNPGSPQFKEGKEVVHEVLQNTDILFLNKEEAELILLNHYGEKDDDSDGYVEKLATKLQKIGVKNVVITNGQDGSYCLSENGQFHKRKMFPGKVVERTGAGDAFATGFLGATLSDLSIDDCMLWGSANAASVVENVGAEKGLLTKLEIEEKVK